MSDIEQLEQRITAALDRLAYGVTQLDAASAGALEQVKAALDEEKTVTAQLQQRVAMLRQKAEDSEAAHTALQAQVSTLDVEMQKLRQANDKLREANQALREANQNGVGDPHLINMAVLVELESLRAARDLERAEADAILSALAPILTSSEEPANA